MSRPECCFCHATYFDEFTTAHCRYFTLPMHAQMPRHRKVLYVTQDERHRCDNGRSTKRSPHCMRARGQARFGTKCASAITRYLFLPRRAMPTLRPSRRLFRPLISDDAFSSKKVPSPRPWQLPGRGWPHFTPRAPPPIRRAPARALFDGATTRRAVDAKQPPASPRQKPASRRA